MANYEFKSFACPNCNGMIDPEKVSLAKEGNVITCPFCGASLDLRKIQSAMEVGYEYQQGVIKATEEYNTKKKKEYAEALRKKQLAAIEAEKKRMAAAEARRRKFEKKSWVSAIMIYVLMIGFAYVLAHESMAWSLSESFSLPKPWFISTNGGIIPQIIGFVLWGFVKIGAILSLVSALCNIGSKMMLVMPWVYLWELGFMVSMFASKNGYGVFEAIEIMIKDIAG